MYNKTDLQDWVFKAVEGSGGAASVIDVAKHIWANHEQDLRQSGDLFFTWQYDMRWAAQALREKGQMSLVRRKWVIKQ